VNNIRRAACSQGYCATVYSIFDRSLAAFAHSLKTYRNALFICRKLKVY